MKCPVPNTFLAIAAIIRIVLVCGVVALLPLPAQSQPATDDVVPESDEAAEPPVPAPGIEPVPVPPLPSLLDEELAAPSEVTPQPQTNQFVFGQFLLASPRSSLASVPPMFGDGFYRGGMLTASESLPGGSMTVDTDVPLAAGNRRLKIAEHNMAVPVDRVYFNYNHFHNALQTNVSGVTSQGVNPGPFTAGDDFSVDRFTLGLEKTLFQGQSSIELRFPLAGRYDFDFETGSPLPEQAIVDGGAFGNLAVITKHVLYADACDVLSAGLGVDIPTGSSAEVQSALARYRIDNQAVYLQPYLALTRVRDAGWFGHAFLQLDIPLNGNSISLETLPPLTPVGGELGKLDDQVLLEVDLGGGRWLYRNRCARLFTGLAAILEVHLTTTLDGADTVAASRGTPFGPDSTLNFTTSGESTIVNMTAGFHTQLGPLSSARFAFALPVSGVEEDRAFDAEVIGQFSRRF